MAATHSSAASRKSGRRKGSRAPPPAGTSSLSSCSSRSWSHATIRPNWFWNDAWDGYPLARQRLLTDVVDAKLRNPVFLTGDWHSTFVNDLKLDFKDPAAATVATEFVTPAITTGGDGTPYGPYYAPMIPVNPHIKYYEGDRRGYFKASVTPARMRVDLRFMTSVESQAGAGYTQGSWVVQDGEPGAQPA